MTIIQDLLLYLSESSSSNDTRQILSVFQNLLNNIQNKYNIILEKYKKIGGKKDETSLFNYKINVKDLDDSQYTYDIEDNTQNFYYNKKKISSIKWSEKFINKIREIINLHENIIKYLILKYNLKKKSIVTI